MTLYTGGGMSKCKINIKGNCDDEKICHCKNCYNNIEEPIFEGAKFRDGFWTRDGRQASFIDSYQLNSDNLANVPNITLYELITEDKIIITVNSEGIVDFENNIEQNDDIVSRYQETIDEEKLEELSYDYIYDKSNDWAYDSDNNWKDVQNAYKDGYHERAKENYGK